MDAEKIQLAESLIGKTVIGAALSDDCLTITLEDQAKSQTKVVSAARCGPGADSEWYNWTQISINGQDVINK